LIKRNSRSAKLLRDLPRRFFSAICDDHTRGASIYEVSRGEFCHLAGADKHHGAAFERVEDLLAELDSHVTDRNCACRDPGLGSDTLGDAKRVMDQTIENASGSACLDGE